MILSSDSVWFPVASALFFYVWFYVLAEVSTLTFGCLLFSSASLRCHISFALCRLQHDAERLWHLIPQSAKVLLCCALLLFTYLCLDFDAWLYPGLYWCFSVSTCVLPVSHIAAVGNDTLISFCMVSSCFRVVRWCLVLCSCWGFDFDVWSSPFL